MTRRGEDALPETIRFYEIAAESLAARWADRTVMKPYLDRFAELVSPLALVVDLGCGAGHDCQELVTRGLRVIGVDSSFALLRIGVARYPALDFARQDLRRLAFRSGSLDGIWACASLVHVPRRQIRSVLSEIRRVLRPGGVLFTSMQGGRGQALVEDQEHGTGLRRLYVYYAAPQWHSLLDEVGFALLEARLDYVAAGLDPGAKYWIA